MKQGNQTNKVYSQITDPKQKQKKILNQVYMYEKVGYRGGVGFTMRNVGLLNKMHSEIIFTKPICAHPHTQNLKTNTTN